METKLLEMLQRWQNELESLIKDDSIEDRTSEVLVDVYIINDSLNELIDRYENA